MTARLLLIRHGQSQWNVEGRIQGQTDVPLTDLGRRQAEALAGRLAAIPLSAVYSSPLRRARDTAEPIARRHGLPVQVLPELTEIDHGAWEGRTEPEIAAIDAERLQLWSTLPGRIRMPDGERLYDVRRRATAAVRTLAAAHPGQVVGVVSHDVVLRVILADLLGLDYDHLGRITIDNAAVSVVHYDGSVARIVTLNDTAHLDGQ